VPPSGRIALALVDQHDRQLLDAGKRAQVHRELEAVFAPEVDVDEDQLVAVLAKCAERAARIAQEVDLDGLLRQLADQLGERLGRIGDREHAARAFGRERARCALLGRGSGHERASRGALVHRGGDRHRELVRALEARERPEAASRTGERALRERARARQQHLARRAPDSARGLVASASAPPRRRAGVGARRRFSQTSASARSRTSVANARRSAFSTSRADSQRETSTAGRSKKIGGAKNLRRLWPRV
jgi:hypothetical protein